jgi:glycosyltransferase involved in cell wall biosynthesis
MSRILVDASAAFDQRAGVGRYSRNILSRLLPAVPDAAWTLFHAPSGGAEVGWARPADARHVRFPLSRRRLDLIAGRLGLPMLIRPLTGAQDLVYSPDFVAPPMRGTPRIVTVHDVAFLTHPRLTTPGTASFLTRVVQREARRGALIAAVSETTKARVVQHLGVPEERVRVIRNGVEERFLAARPLAAWGRTQLGLPDAYLLMVGTIEPRKNHAGVLRAIARHDSGLPLVIVGQPGWDTEPEVATIRELQRRGRVVWLEDLDDRHLPAVYASSRGVLYPSWTEGFGLPVLEALATGRPVVTGDDPVFAEVGRGYELRVSPGDDDAILEAIRTLETAPDDPASADARRRHAAQYGWDTPVTMLVAWIRQLTGGRT